MERRAFELLQLATAGAIDALQAQVARIIMELHAGRAPSGSTRSAGVAPGDVVVTGLGHGPMSTPDAPPIKLVANTATVGEQQ